MLRLAYMLFEAVHICTTLVLVHAYFHKVSGNKLHLSVDDAIKTAWMTLTLVVVSWVYSLSADLISNRYGLHGMLFDVRRILYAKTLYNGYIGTSTLRTAKNYFGFEVVVPFEPMLYLITPILLLLGLDKLNTPLRLFSVVSLLALIYAKFECRAHDCLSEWSTYRLST